MHRVSELQGLESLRMSRSGLIAGPARPCPGSFLPVVYRGFSYRGSVNPFEGSAIQAVGSRPACPPNYPSPKARFPASKARRG